MGLFNRLNLVGLITVLIFNFSAKAVAAEEKVVLGQINLSFYQVTASVILRSTGKARSYCRGQGRRS